MHLFEGKLQPATREMSEATGITIVELAQIVLITLAESEGLQSITTSVNPSFLSSSQTCATAVFWRLGLFAIVASSSPLLSELGTMERLGSISTRESRTFCGSSKISRKTGWFSPTTTLNANDADACESRSKMQTRWPYCFARVARETVAVVLLHPPRRLRWEMTRNE